MDCSGHEKRLEDDLPGNTVVAGDLEIWSFELFLRRRLPDHNRRKALLVSTHLTGAAILQLDPKKLEEIWMRNIQKSPAYFLRRRFAMQAAREKRQ